MSAQRSAVEIQDAAGNVVPLLQTLPEHAAAGLHSNTPITSLLPAQLEHRPAFAHVKFNLQPNQDIITQGGALRWMEGGMNASVECCQGGCVNGCCRGFANEPCCYNKFSGPGEASFGFELPGDMLPFAVTPGNGWIISQEAFIAGTPNLEINSKCTSFLACLCTDTGCCLPTINTVNGNGVFFAGSFGQIQRLDVPAGGSVMVASGMFFAASDRAKFSIAMPGDCNSLCFSGEGLVLKFEGPCVLYIRNRNPTQFKKILNPFPTEEVLKALEVAGEIAAAAK